jgi:hypothetical protein
MSSLRRAYYEKHNCGNRAGRRASRCCPAAFSLAEDVAIDPNADLRVENFSKELQVGFPLGWTNIDQMMVYMGFVDRPVVPQLILIDRDGNIHYRTPREGDALSLKEDVITKRIEELIELKSTAKRPRSSGSIKLNAGQ